MIEKRCPYCRSKNIRKHGTYRTQGRGIKQRWFCNKCAETWTENK